MIGEGSVCSSGPVISGFSGAGLEFCDPGSSTRLIIVVSRVRVPPSLLDTKLLIRALLIARAFR